MSESRPKLGELLRKKGLVSQEQLEELLRAQRTSTKEIRLGALAREKGYLGERALTVLLGSQQQVPIVLHLERIDIDPEAVAAVPRSLAERFLVVPLSICDDGRLIVATTDPTNQMLFRALEQHSGREVKPAIAPESDILEMLDKVYDEHEAMDDSAVPQGVLPAQPDGVSSSMAAIDNVFASILD